MGENQKKIFARKLTVTELDKKIAQTFLDENHLQGKVNKGDYLALVDGNNDIYALMVFDEALPSRSHDLELVRFCSLAGYNVIGGASKLLAHYRKNHKGKELVTYSDNRWSDGNFYLNIGFEFTGDVRPRFYYVGPYTKWKIKHRFNFTKKRIQKIFNDYRDLTESELAKENELYRIWDCGHKKFSLIC
jgi:hypothetical protein